MALIKIAKNTSGDTETFGGKTLANNETYELSKFEWIRWSEDQNIRDAVTSGDLTMNDGSVDLSVADGLKLLDQFQETEAEDVSFDNSTNGFAADNVQDAIEETNSSFLDHSDRHLPNGADALDTDAAVTIDADTANAEGNSNSFARANHTHEIPTAAPLGELGGVSANFAGTASSLARSDHAHAIETGPPSTLIPGQASNQTGSGPALARASHVHSVPTDAASTIQAGGANTEGTSNSFARADHEHAISVDPSTITGVTQTELQKALEELGNLGGAREVFFQFIGKMNFDQYLIAGSHITSNNIRRSGDPSNGATFSNAAPQMSPIDGNVITVSINARGLAVSTGSPAATINLNLELWKVGQTGGEGTKLGDIVVAIPTAGETIGTFWNSSVFTAYGAKEDVSPTIAVNAGDLLGLKFIRKTGNSDVVSVDNLTVTLGLARS